MDTISVVVLIALLGSPNFNIRKEAHQQLEKYGYNISPILLVAKENNNLEIARRASILYRSAVSEWAHYWATKQRFKPFTQGWVQDGKISNGDYEVYLMLARDKVPSHRKEHATRLWVIDRLMEGESIDQVAYLIEGEQSPQPTGYRLGDVLLVGAIVLGVVGLIVGIILIIIKLRRKKEAEVNLPLSTETQKIILLLADFNAWKKTTSDCNLVHRLSGIVVTGLGDVQLVAGGGKMYLTTKDRQAIKQAHRKAEDAIQDKFIVEYVENPCDGIISSTCCLGEITGTGAALKIVNVMRHCPGWRPYSFGVINRMHSIKVTHWGNCWYWDGSGSSEQNPYVMGLSKQDEQLIASEYPQLAIKAQRDFVASVKA